MAVTIYKVEIVFRDGTKAVLGQPSADTWKRDVGLPQVLMYREYYADGSIQAGADILSLNDDQLMDYTESKTLEEAEAVRQAHLDTKAGVGKMIPYEEILRMYKVPPTLRVVK